MFLKKNTRKNWLTKIPYTTYTLVQSVKKPWHKFYSHNYVASVGNLDWFVDQEKEELRLYLEFHIHWKISLLDIEMASEKIKQKGEEVLKSYRDHQSLQEKKDGIGDSKQQKRSNWNYTEMDSSTLQTIDRKTIWAEYVCSDIIKEIGLQTIFNDIWLTIRQQEVAIALVVNRCISPGSEEHARKRLRDISALWEIRWYNFGNVNRKTIYIILKLLNKHHEKIEYLLAQNEEQYRSDDTIILYDLTNSYFEWQAKANTIAAYGRSKEKRTDCKLVTLGFVVNRDGFPKFSRIYKWNQSEPKTFIDIIEQLKKDYPLGKDKLIEVKPLVVMDAWIATEENLKRLRLWGYQYVVVKRSSKAEWEVNGDYELVKEMRSHSWEVINTIEIRRNESKEELFLECKSKKKNQKETSIQEKLEWLFESKLISLQESIGKGTIKKANTINQKIGKLLWSYSRVSQYYDINYKASEKKLLRSKNEEKQNLYKKKRERYILRTNCKIATDKEIRDVYNTIRRVEDCFRTMKTDLRLRPIFHQEEEYTRAHIFLTVLAYHIVNIVLYKLKRESESIRRTTFLTDMATQTVGTITFEDISWKQNWIRVVDRPTQRQEELYKKLKINSQVLLNRKLY